MFSELLAAKPKMSEGTLVISKIKDLHTIVLLAEYDMRGDATLLYFEDRAGPYLESCGISLWDFADVGEVGEYAIFWMDA